MPTNNLSPTLGPGKEEEEDKGGGGEEGLKEEQEEDETASARTKCPAQGRECERWAIEGTER